MRNGDEGGPKRVGSATPNRLTCPRPVMPCARALCPRASHCSSRCGGYKDSMSPHGDILIIGGGVIGLTTAYFLARDGARVTVVDQADFGQEVSWAGAGILPAGEQERWDHPVEHLRARSAAMFPSLSAELRELTGIDNGYVRCGGLEFPEEESESGARRHSTIRASRTEWHGEDAQLLDAEEVRRLEPALAGNLGPAYHLPDTAQIRNPRHIKALLAACHQRGVRLTPGCPVGGFITNGPRVLAAKALGGELAADRFLIATGAWSDPLLEHLGCRPGIKPIRGQIVLLRLDRPIFRMVLIRGACYLVPRSDGRVLIGSTEEDVGYDKRTTAGAIADLIALAVGLVPALADAPVERCWAGLRPGSPDGLPFLGPAPSWDNVFVAAGHFRAGIQLSPGTALVMKECLLGQSPTMPLQPFRLDRPV
jgi:glycine oxidase